MKVLNANIEEIHVRVKPIKTSYCLMLQSKALIPDNTPYPLLFILLNILYCVIRPKITFLFGYMCLICYNIGNHIMTFTKLTSCHVRC